MVRNTTPEDKLNDLISELLSQVPVEKRCEFLYKDNLGLYCSKDIKPNEPVAEQRRNVCGLYSLQLWCLDKERVKKCIWYNGEPFSSL